MTKRLAGFAVIAAAAATFVLPASPANASCPTPRQCIHELTDVVTIQEICVIREDTIGLYVCV